jgi:hypothetical protein
MSTYIPLTSTSRLLTLTDPVRIDGAGGDTCGYIPGRNHLDGPSFYNACRKHRAQDSCCQTCSKDQLGWDCAKSDGCYK